MKIATFRFVLVILLAPAVLGLSSCGAIAWTAAQLEPPHKVKALYVPPANRKVLVFVDDIRTPVNYEPIKRELTERLNQQLVDHKLAGQTISYERLLDVVAGNQNFNDLYVVDVGKKVDADVVLYVEITNFRLKQAPETPVWEGRLETSVRWVDVHATTPSEARLWPKDRPGATGYDVAAIETPAKEDPSLSYGAELAKNLADRTADRIARLFYDYEVAPQSRE